MDSNPITRETLIEDLVTILPDSVTYLMQKGIRCMRCGEPMWGTLEAAAVEKGFSLAEVDAFAADLDALHEAQIGTSHHS